MINMLGDIYDRTRSLTGHSGGQSCAGGVGEELKDGHGPQEHVELWDEAHQTLLLGGGQGLELGHRGATVLHTLTLTIAIAVT